MQVYNKQTSEIASTCTLQVYKQRVSQMIGIYTLQVCSQRVNKTIGIYTLQHRGRDRQVYNQRVSERINIYTMLHCQGETGIYAFVHTAMSILNNCMDMEGQGTLHEFAKNQFTGSQKTRFMEETFEKTKMFSSFHPYNMFQFFCPHNKIMTVSLYL